jgi:predicted RNase H-like HicB family nuclease
MEIPEANGQGESIEECRQSLIEAIKLVIEDQKNDIMVNVPNGMIEEIRVQ